MVASTIVVGHVNDGGVGLARLYSVACIVSGLVIVARVGAHAPSEYRKYSSVKFGKYLGAVGRHLELVHHDVHIERTRLSR